MVTILPPDEREALRLRWPAGMRVILRRTTDEYTDLEPGDLGTVTGVDDAGTVHIAWDRGNRLGMILGVDQFEEVRG